MREYGAYGIPSGDGGSDRLILSNSAYNSAFASLIEVGVGADVECAFLCPVLTSGHSGAHLAAGRHPLSDLRR